MKPSKIEFLQKKNKAITLIGMSGVGKTTLSNKLPKDNWFHYSADYRIGTKYLSEPIMDNVKYEAMKSPLLRELLCSDSIYLANNISIDNLTPISKFLGQLGDPSKGGLDLDTFKQRQKLHEQAEIDAILDVPEFINKSRKIYQYDHFLNDVGGSICEVATKKVLETLAEHTVIIYLKADDLMEQAIIKRAVSAPKPLFYNLDFLSKNVSIYLKEHNLSEVAQITPDKFSEWIFPRLISHRKPLYQKIADDYGYTLDANQISGINNESELLDWISEKL